MDDRQARIINRTLRYEGGFSNDPQDSGGATNWGITRRDLSVWRKHSVTVNDVRRLSREEAVEIYQHMYWDIPNIGLLPEEVQQIVFDAGVNLGIVTDDVMFQKALNLLGAKIKIDGKIGLATEQATELVIKTKGAKAVIEAFCTAWKAHYASIVAHNPKDRKYLHGWDLRAEENEKEAERNVG